MNFIFCSKEKKSKSDGKYGSLYTKILKKKKRGSERKNSQKKMYSAKVRVSFNYLTKASYFEQVTYTD